MCVVSMVMEQKYWEWDRRYHPPILPFGSIPPTPPLPTQEEVDEFRRLLERAREYDKRNNEPDCEMEEKREKLRALAKELGVEIGFLTSPPV